MILSPMPAAQKRVYNPRRVPEPPSPMKLAAKAASTSTGPKNIDWNAQAWGTMDDKSMARILGVNVYTVARERIKRGFRPYRSPEATRRTCVLDNTVKPTRANDLPPDYAHSFAMPRHHEDCCYVLRTVNGGAYPRPAKRCGQRRLGAKFKGGEPRLCCTAHKAHEDAARAWMELHNA